MDDLAQVRRRGRSRTCSALLGCLDEVIAQGSQLFDAVEVQGDLAVAAAELDGGGEAKGGADLTPFLALYAAMSVAFLVLVNDMQ